jgi:CRP-like cAMP-binding protein
VSGVSPSALAGHAFVRGLPTEHMARLAEVATVTSVPAGYRFFEEGGRASQFWLISIGHVALDIYLPGRPRLIVETIGADGLVGLSWVAPPQEWQYGAEAVQPTSAFELDAAAVLALCDSDPALGYQVTRRLLAIASRRMHASRIRMMDLYAVPGGKAGAP